MKETPDWQKHLPQIEKIASSYKDKPEQLMRLLLQIQAITSNAVPNEVANIVSRATGIPKNKIYGYITFYAMFREKPRGKYIIRMCKSAPCFICGAQGVMNAVADALSIQPGETTNDGLFTLEYCECIGLCDISPAIMINDKIYGELTPEKAKEIIERYKNGEVE